MEVPDCLRKHRQKMQWSLGVLWSVGMGVLFLVHYL